MYCLANNKALPFEGGLTTKSEAVKMRTDGTAITAPKNGNEKLKSIIVIAIQPKNENRWKNAVNMKNALLASCGKLTAEPEKTQEKQEEKETPAVTGAVPTLFEQAEKAEKDKKAEDNTEKSTQPEETKEPVENKPDVPVVKEDEAKVTETNSEDTAKIKPQAAEKENSVAPDVPISNDVFDEYEVTKKPDTQVKASTKDYGSFFDDIDDTDSKKAEPVKNTVSETETKKPEPVKQKPEKNEIKSSIPIDYKSKNTKNAEADEKPRKKGATIAIITVSVIIILAVLGFVGYIVYNEIFAEKINNTKPATADEITTAATTVPPTTVAPTTQPTTVAEKEIISVIGYDYESAKNKLEEQGFKVAEGNHLYSTLYSEGYVISQSPESGTKAKPGTVITLDISLGEEYVEPETTAPEESSQSSATENDFIFANSDSSYISQSEVKDLSDNNLELALNEIYAKRGWIFSDPELSAYFNSQSWYTPRYTSSEFSKNVTFNEYEQANIQLIINEQKSRGIR